MPSDIVLLFTTRCLRMFSYGAITVVFFIALNKTFPTGEVDYILTAILLGDLGVSLYLTTRADRFGRRNTLMIGALLKTIAGIGFAMTDNFLLIVLTGIIGVISPTGGDIGPFISVEQSALTQLCSVDDSGAKVSPADAVVRVTNVFAFYQMFGSVALALGALCAGWIVELLPRSGWGLTEMSAYRSIFLMYALMGLLKCAIYMPLSNKIEPTEAELAAKDKSAEKSRFLLGGLLIGLDSDESRKTVAGLCVLFSMDAFGGGLVLQSYMSWWFNIRWGLEPSKLGELLMAVNIIAGVSGLAAGYLMKRVGAINTMVFTHLPSNILLAMVPMMPTKGTAIAMILLRFSISQMDVPARQAYVTLVVKKAELSAANGWTNCSRSIGTSMGPAVLALIIAKYGLPPMYGIPGVVSTQTTMGIDLPFYLAGGIKIFYDIVLYVSYHTSGAQVGQQLTPQTDPTKAKDYGTLNKV